MPAVHSKIESAAREPQNGGVYLESADDIDFPSTASPVRISTRSQLMNHDFDSIVATKCWL